ncbi:hypothetical protein FNV43_RR08511 [Rhamnella rubrinervis]|uniref:TIR domain-containing protein n=1 Tax=Rhamnella rubrinervis TaxID=2594499 RepID=A0A8K0H8Q4_9ROSA|nr:hypothetical protein FNV43_RR08511 [Rhamnella rubrinervis]
MGGIGKSTLATAYFHEVRADFDCRSFLSNVKETCERKENGLVGLQKQLLSDILREKGGSFSEIGHVDGGKNMIRSRLCNIKVLVVLDDVSKLEQLDAIAGSHEKKNGLDHDELDKWFGPGSRIIVTTRYKDLLSEKYEKYEVERLNFSEALELFSLKSFGSNEPPDEYKELSEQAVHCAEYLPLALNVFASLLRSKKNVNEWKGALTRLENYPAKEIVDKLKISYDDLDATGCIELLEIDPSITLLGKLTTLNLKNCTSLEKLPPSIKGLNSLKSLNLNGCRKLFQIPEDIGDLQNLKELDVRESGMDPALSKTKHYDVFLSFRDLRHAFTGLLRSALHRKGIFYSFNEEVDIATGQLISQAIMDAIQSSQISVVVLSENYAFSRWCLRELCKIVECMDTSGLVVVPIFYHVNPSDGLKFKFLQLWSGRKGLEPRAGHMQVNKDIESNFILDFVEGLCRKLVLPSHNWHLTRLPP